MRYARIDGGISQSILRRKAQSANHPSLEQEPRALRSSRYGVTVDGRFTMANHLEGYKWAGQDVVINLPIGIALSTASTKPDYVKGEPIVRMVSMGRGTADRTRLPFYDSPLEGRKQHSVGVAISADAQEFVFGHSLIKVGFV